jgi:hypothetical protein
MRLRQLIPHPTDPRLMLVPLAGGKDFAIIDARHATEVGFHNWRALPSRNTTYAVSSGRQGELATLYLHRLIGQLLGFDSQLLVDHCDRNGLNNSDGNLRPATPTENWHNGKFRHGLRLDAAGFIWGVV